VNVVELLALTYRPLLAFADELDDARGWLPTALPGWCVRDLVFHLAADCQRALVALATPADGPANTDEVSYWSHWQPGTSGAQSGLRGTRIIASAWSSVRGPADLYSETARAVLVAAGRVGLDEIVGTQGYRLTAESLLRTLVVEAAMHHLDLVPVLPSPPSGEALAEVRHVLDGLLGEPAPTDWDDVRYAQIGTGRAELTDAERATLGPRAERFPLFG
jgi:hypothetical protein